MQLQGGAVTGFLEIHVLAVSALEGYFLSLPKTFAGDYKIKNPEITMK